MKGDSKVHQTLQGLLEERMRELEASGGARACRDQRHLEQGTEERVYWHYGYATALKDVLSILRGGRQAVN